MDVGDGSSVKIGLDQGRNQDLRKGGLECRMKNCQEAKITCTANRSLIICYLEYSSSMFFAITPAFYNKRTM